MQHRLIYDVGAHDGADTAFYLRRGYRVLGIEASPPMAELLRRRFAEEIAAGRLTLLDVGVAETEGDRTFWMSARPEWSSFHRDIAGRNGTTVGSVRIATRRFQDIIAEHGVPYYCKIDIEGSDHLCLAALTPATAPPYISVEMSHADGGRDITRLRDLGYDGFKIVSQVTRAQPVRLLTRLCYALPTRSGRRLRRILQHVSGVRTVDGWKFPAGASGAFAEDTPGRWKSWTATIALWQFLRDLDRDYRSNGLAEWFDVHARRTRAAASVRKVGDPKGKKHHVSDFQYKSAT